LIGWIFAAALSMSAGFSFQRGRFGLRFLEVGLAEFAGHKAL
jgi:hypothetical protein